MLRGLFYAMAWYCLGFSAYLVAAGAYQGNAFYVFLSIIIALCSAALFHLHNLLERTDDEDQ